MCDDGRFIYLEVFPFTHMEAIYLVGSGVGRTLGLPSQAMFLSIRLDSGRSLVLTLRLLDHFCQSLETRTLVERPLCMSESQNF